MVEFGVVTGIMGHSHLYLRVNEKILGYFHIGEDPFMFFGFFPSIVDNSENIKWLSGTHSMLKASNFIPFK